MNRSLSFALAAAFLLLSLISCSSPGGAGSSGSPDSGGPPNTSVSSSASGSEDGSGSGSGSESLLDTSAGSSSSSGDVSAPDTSSSSSEEDGDPDLEEALRQYRQVVDMADSIDFPDPYGESPVTYRYALIQLNQGDTLPTLLLSQDCEGLSSIRLFRYSAETRSLIKPAELMDEGVAGVGGYRGSLSINGDGDGLCSITISAGTGQMDVYRITLQGDSLVTEEVWSGRMGEGNPPGTSMDIPWHDVSDLSALDSWAPVPSRDGAGQAAAADLPEDGDRTVLSGTLMKYTAKELMDLQGLEGTEDMYALPGSVFVVLILDSPQDLIALSGDGSGEMYSSTASMVCLECEINEALLGQHVTASVDPNSTWWPSDVSLPVGEPYTSDIHILF